MATLYVSLCHSHVPAPYLNIRKAWRGSFWAGRKLPARDVLISRKLHGHAVRRQWGGWQGSLCRRWKWQHQLTCAALGDIGLHWQQRLTEAIRTNMSKYFIDSTYWTFTASLRQYQGQWHHERRYFCHTLSIASVLRNYSKSELVRSVVAYRLGDSALRHVVHRDVYVAEGRLHWGPVLFIG
jgi:hypothetical protein